MTDEIGIAHVWLIQEPIFSLFRNALPVDVQLCIQFFEYYKFMIVKLKF